MASLEPDLVTTVVIENIHLYVCLHAVASTNMKCCRPMLFYLNFLRKKWKKLGVINHVLFVNDSLHINF